MSDINHPPLYSDMPPSYNDAIARISPLDSSLSRTFHYSYHAILLPYNFVPLWQFPNENIPNFYIDSSFPGWNAGIEECNETLRLISTRQFQLYLSHFFIFSGCISAFYIAALSQKGTVIQFENSKIILPSIAALIIIFLLLLSYSLRHKIMSIREPIAALKQSVGRMGWVLENFYPRLGFTPEIQITAYERSL